MKLTVIIPCYNCSKSINRNYKKIYNKVKNFFSKSEYILIDDGSSDETKRKLFHIKKNYPNIKLILNKENIGKSLSIKKGLKISSGKKIMIYDCDLPYFSKLNEFLKKLKSNNFVIINRRSKKNKLVIKKFSFYKILRYFIGNIISLISRKILSIQVRDTQAGLKGFTNSKKLKKQSFISKRFFIDIEIIMFFLKRGISPVFVNVETIIDQKASSIKILDLKKNLEIFKEYCSVLKKYS